MKNIKVQILASMIEVSLFFLLGAGVIWSFKLFLRVIGVF